MPPKRPSPLEDPPSASSTSGDETEDEEVQATDGEEEEEVGSEEEEVLEEPKPTQPSRPIPKSKPISKPQSSVPKPQSSDDDDSDEDSGEEKVNLADDSTSDSESENGPVKHMIAPREIKPISSKPMNEPPKPKKPTPTPAPTSTVSASKTSSAAKRPLENEKKDKRDRKKKKVADLDDEEIEKKGGEDKKNLFERIWSEEDEIVILKGLIDYKKKGFNPFSNNTMSGFLDFIKNSLHVENVKNNQLVNKVQRLKQKYQKNASRAKPGEEPVISRPHELNSYQLSKQIWGEQSLKDEGVEGNHIGSESVKSDVKKSKNQVSSNGVASSPKRKRLTKVAADSPKVVANSPKVVADSPKVETSSQKVERKEEDTTSGPDFFFLNGSVQSHSIPLMPVPPQGLGEIFAKKGWDSIKNLNAGTLDQRWKAMLIAETQVYLDRLELVRDQTKGMLDALMSSDF